MKAVVQRVKNASVSVEGKITGRIETGLLVYLGVAAGDRKDEADWMAGKIANLRIFDDAEGKMNLSIKDLASAGETQEAYKIPKQPAPGVLAISQFTLLGDARKGRRPSWGGVVSPEIAKPLYEYFIAKIRSQGLNCEEGIFQARMEVSYTNEGPVTILLDTRETGNLS